MKYLMLLTLAGCTTVNNYAPEYDAAIETKDGSRVADAQAFTDASITPDMARRYDFAVAHDFAQAQDMSSPPDLATPVPVCVPFNTPGYMMFIPCGCTGLPCCKGNAQHPSGAMCKPGMGLICQGNMAVGDGWGCMPCGGQGQGCCGEAVHSYQLTCNAPLVCHCQGENLGDPCRTDLAGLTECKP